MKKHTSLALFLVGSVLFVTQVFAQLLLLDDQSYTVSRTDTNWLATITANSGWTSGKATNTSGVYPPTAPGYGNGYIYTVDSIPGVSAPIPGNGRALAFEGHDGTVHEQTDFYLKYGDGEGPPGQIPGDVWFQFWVLWDPDPAWFTHFAHPKFIYPNKRGFYPATSLADQDWLAHFGTGSYLPHMIDNPGNGHTFMAVFNTAAGQTSNYGAPGECVSVDIYWRLGQVQASRPYIPGIWYLVRFHANTSQPAVTGNRHLWEVHRRQYGESEWHLMSRWQHGQDFEPGPGLGCTLNWLLDTTTHGYGHRIMVVPSTVGPANGSGRNTRFYLKDFAMAAGIDSGGPGQTALPSYTDGGPNPPPAAPANLSVVP